MWKILVDPKELEQLLAKTAAEAAAMATKALEEKQAAEKAAAEKVGIVLPGQKWWAPTSEGVLSKFSVGGSENRPIYNESDPFCRTRKPDDHSWTIDHFYRKLLFLEKKMNTKYGKSLAKKRTKIMMAFLSELKTEI